MQKLIYLIILIMIYLFCLNRYYESIEREIPAKGFDYD